MWTPSVFRAPDRGSLHDLMEAHSFATLVSTTEGGLFATHLPFLLDRDRGPFGTLIAHLARRNPHWQSLEGREVLVVFQGPHAYVSPAWYEEQVTVPTWNYAVAHAYGTPRLVHDPERLRPMVERLMRRHEDAVASSWDPRRAESAIASELSGIVGFEIEISRLEGKLKLNQNRSREDREGVARALESSGDPSHRELAGLMRRQLESS